MEKFIVVTVNQDNLAQLIGLVNAADGEVVASFTQNIKRIDTRTLIGSGKVKEIAEKVKELAVDGVIFSRVLTGSQQSNLSDLLSVKVIDRTQLILDIFGKRAHSQQSQLQIKLAQLEYQLPRLVGLKSNLSKTGGGIGTRGLGEQQLELDRRKIQRQIQAIKKQLVKFTNQRQVLRKQKLKSTLPLVALVGYTNAGKSTIFNQLIAKREKEVLAQDMLFASLDVVTRSAVLPSGNPYLLMDTVGFVEDLPLQLFDAFKATLMEVVDADLVIIVVDSSIKQPYEQLEIVQDTIKDYLDEQRVLVFFNKRVLLYEKPMGGLSISALNPKQIERLRLEIQRALLVDFTKS